MNCTTARKYWCSNYQQHFGETYSNDKIGIELSFLKRCIGKYTYFAVLDAIDIALDTANKSTATILYQINPKYFEDKYNFRYGLYKISKYRRFIGLYDKDLNNTVNELLKEYRIASHELSTDYDLIRKKEILKELQEVTKDFFEKVGIHE